MKTVDIHRQQIHLVFPPSVFHAFYLHRHCLMRNRPFSSNSHPSPNWEAEPIAWQCMFNPRIRAMITGQTSSPNDFSWESEERRKCRAGIYASNANKRQNDSLSDATSQDEVSSLPRHPRIYWLQTCQAYTLCNNAREPQMYWCADTPQTGVIERTRSLIILRMKRQPPG